MHQRCKRNLQQNERNDLIQFLTLRSFLFQLIKLLRMFVVKTKTDSQQYWLL